MKSEVISKRIIVPASSIDIRGHVNNLVYLQWCLDAAEAHWISKSTEDIRQKYVWYVIENNIQYRASAFEGEELELQTWVHSTYGVKSERHYKITRLNDNKTIVDAKTIWCLLDGKTLRLTKITEEISNLFA